MKKEILLLLTVFFAVFSAEAQTLENNLIVFDEETSYTVISQLGDEIQRGDGYSVETENLKNGYYYIKINGGEKIASFVVIQPLVVSLKTHEVLKAKMDLREKFLINRGVRTSEYEESIRDLGIVPSRINTLDPANFDSTEYRKLSWTLQDSVINATFDYLMPAVRAFQREEGIISYEGSRDYPLYEGTPCSNPLEGLTASDLDSMAEAQNIEIPPGLVHPHTILEPLPVRTMSEMWEECYETVSNYADNFQDSVRIVYRYYYKNIATHSGGNSPGVYIDNSWEYELSALVDSLQGGHGATWCGGHSDGLIMFFDLFEIPAYNMGWGKGTEGDLGGDAATFVVSPSGEVYIVSAMFEIHLIYTPTGEMLDIFRYLDLMNQGKRDSVGFDEGNSKSNYLKIEYPVLNPLAALAYYYDGRTCDVHCAQVDGRFILKAPREYWRYLGLEEGRAEFDSIGDYWLPKLLGAVIGGVSSPYPSYNFETYEDSDLLPLYIKGVWGANQTAVESSLWTAEELWDLYQARRGYYNDF